MKFIRNSLVFLLAAFILVVPVLSIAQTINPIDDGGTITPIDDGSTITPAGNGKLINPISANTVNDFLKAILKGIIKISIPVIALAIIYSGFLFVFAQGNSEKLETAKRAFTFAIIGAAILLGAWALSILISETVLSIGG